MLRRMFDKLTREKLSNVSRRYQWLFCVRTPVSRLIYRDHADFSEPDMVPTLNSNSSFELMKFEMFNQMYN